MIPVFYDFETYWSVAHSLTKMPAPLYVLHPETEIQSCSIQIGVNGECKVYFGWDEINQALLAIKWDDAIAVAHNNSGFDAMILAWRFGIRPARWACTLFMAIPFFANTVGVSLKAVGKALGCKTQKGDLAIVNTKGKKLIDFTPDEVAKMRQYNGDDTRLCAEVFAALMPATLKREMRMMHLTIQQSIDSPLKLDTPLLDDALASEKASKEAKLIMLAQRLNYEATSLEDAVDFLEQQLMSAAKFSALLESLGVAVPMKQSPSDPQRMIPALAKTDAGFEALLESEDEIVSLAARARLGLKSTLLESRIELLLKTYHAMQGTLPVTLRYHGAHTGRWSGLYYNLQNLPRITPGEGNEKRSDALRTSIMAPDGYRLIVCDFTGIELRINLSLWKVQYAMEAWKASPADADLYRMMAADMFGVAFEDVDKPKRQAGKITHLGCGFGVGKVKFKDVARNFGLILTEEEAETYVLAYRRKHAQVVQGWKTCHAALTAIYTGDERAVDPYGLVHTSKEGLVLPSGRLIRYPDLRQEFVEGKTDPEWKYGAGRHTRRIYAGKVDENIVQALARDALVDKLEDVKRITGFDSIGSCHDEPWWCVPVSEADAFLKVALEEMRRPLPWWPELTLWAEGDLAVRYGDAK